MMARRLTLVVAGAFAASVLMAGAAQAGVRSPLFAEVEQRCEK